MLAGLLSAGIVGADGTFAQDRGERGGKGDGEEEEGGDEEEEEEGDEAPKKSMSKKKEKKKAEERRVRSGVEDCERFADHDGMLNCELLNVFSCWL